MNSFSEIEFGVVRGVGSRFLGGVDLSFVEGGDFVGADFWRGGRFQFCGGGDF